MDRVSRRSPEEHAERSSAALRQEWGLTALTALQQADAVLLDVGAEAERQRCAICGRREGGMGM